MINSYRRYLKELEILVSDKNKDLFTKIKELDLVISGEEFVMDVNVLPIKSSLYTSKTGYTTQKNTLKTNRTIFTNKK